MFKKVKLPPPLELESALSVRAVLVEATLACIAILPQEERDTLRPLLETAPEMVIVADSMEAVSVRSVVILDKVA